MAPRERVTHQDQMKEGTIIAYMCEHKKVEIKAEVLGFLEPVVENVIICRRLDEEMADLVDFTKTAVYVVSRPGSLENSCQCGAKFTSNPNYHFSYCPLK